MYLPLSATPPHPHVCSSRGPLTKTISLQLSSAPWVLLSPQVGQSPGMCQHHQHQVFVKDKTVPSNRKCASGPALEAREAPDSCPSGKLTRRCWDPQAGAWSLRVFHCYSLYLTCVLQAFFYLYSVLMILDVLMTECINDPGGHSIAHTPLTDLANSFLLPLPPQSHIYDGRWHDVIHLYITTLSIYTKHNWFIGDLVEGYESNPVLFYQQRTPHCNWGLFFNKTF